MADNQTEMKNQHAYDDLKQKNLLTLDEWVVFHEEKLLSSTKTKDEAISAIIKSKATNCFLAQVGTTLRLAYFEIFPVIVYILSLSTHPLLLGHENDSIDIDSVHCSGELRC
jgi:hypothetical protein